MDLEQKAIERIRLASDLSLKHYVDEEDAKC